MTAGTAAASFLMVKKFSGFVLMLSFSGFTFGELSRLFQASSVQPSMSVDSADIMAGKPELMPLQFTSSAILTQYSFLIPDAIAIEQKKLSIILTHPDAITAHIAVSPHLMDALLMNYDDLLKIKIHCESFVENTFEFHSRVFDQRKILSYNI